METHASIIYWTILWTEESGRLQSMELQRVSHDWATEHRAHHVYILHILQTSYTIKVLKEKVAIISRNS